MKRSWLRWTVLALFVIGSAVAVRWLRHNNDRLRGDLAQAKRRQQALAGLRAENDRARALLVASANADAQQTWVAEAARLREEIAAHEREVESRRTRGRARSAAVDANRDPVREPMRIANLQDVGREKPEAALQTLFWAACKGEDARVAQMVAFAPGARERIDALRANWSAEARQRYPSAEAVAAVFLAETVTGHETVQLLEARALDPTRAELTVNFDGAMAALPLPMVRSPEGWQLSITDELGDELLRALRARPVADARP